jgi:enoyl-CoA hydratase/carnithine racemase
MSAQTDQPATALEDQARRIDLTGPLPGLLYEKIDHTAVITVNRPDAGNALTRQMRPALLAIWRDVMNDGGVRCVVITSTGERHFCSGTDLKDVAETGTIASGSGPLNEELIWSPLVMGVWKPVICAVNGLVAGGGLHFVVDSDIVVASENAAFLDTHTGVGMVGGVENIGLAHRINLGEVLRMTFCGKAYRVSAPRAYDLGLVTEVVAPDELMPRAMEIASQISRNSPRANLLSKQAIWHSLGRPLPEAMEHGWDVLRSHWSHPDFAEGPRAFVERREPKWQDA